MTAQVERMMSRKHPHHEANHDYGQQDDQSKDNIELLAMLFCGPNFRKAAFLATINSPSPHGVHAAQLVFFHVFATALWTHTGVLHDCEMMNPAI
tara:strand:+ start:71 stop:355 length:285 start_codon:yes stop_codon:yes gene_type:complete